MVPDEVDMELEAVKCGMCIVKEMNVVKGEKDLLRKEVGELRKEIGELKKEVGELRVQSINKDKKLADVKTKEEHSWAIVAKIMKSHNVFERLEKVESDMIVKKSVIMKEVKSTNEEETRKKRIMIFNLKNKTGKSDVECVKDVVGKMGAGQSCDDVVDVVRLRQKENGPIIRPIIMEFRSEYDKWTVMRMKAKLRECEEYRSVFFRDGSVKGRERGKEGKSNEAERRENTESEAIGVNGMATEKRSIAVVLKNVRKMRSRERQSEIMDWIERSNCDICAVNETGLTGEEYMLQVESGPKGRSGGAGFIIKKGFDVRK